MGVTRFPAEDILETHESAPDPHTGYRLESDSYNKTEIDTALSGKEDAYTKISAKVYPSADLSVANGVNTKVRINTTAESMGGDYLDEVNYRWTPPAGTYVVNGSIRFLSMTAGKKGYIYINRNGTTEAYAEITSGGGSSTTCTLSYIAVMNGTDYLELSCYHNEGSNLTLSSWVGATYLNTVRVY